jgi:hypothetical protein
MLVKVFAVVWIRDYEYYLWDVTLHDRVFDSQHYEKV